MSGLRTRAALSVSVLAAAGLAATALPSTAQAAAKPRVVALGDSYASGEGLGSYDADTNRSGNDCHRSLGSWQRQLNEGKGAINEQNANYDYRQVACSGSTTQNITRDLPSVMGAGRKATQAGEPDYQIDALNGTESYVLLSIGGNDLNFVPAVKACTTNFRTSVCTDAIARSRNAIPAAMGNVDRIVQDIARKSPNAKIVIAGYPYVIDGPSNGFMCTGIFSDEASTIASMVSALDSAYAAKVSNLRSRGYKVRYVNTASEWKADGKRHDACVMNTNWINPPTSTGITSSTYHPNKAGYAAYTRAANRVLTS